MAVGEKQLNYRVELVDNITADMRKVQRLTVSSLGKMNKEQQKLANSIDETREKRMKLTKIMLSGDKAQNAELRKTIALMKQQETIQMRLLRASKRQERGGGFGKSKGLTAGAASLLGGVGLSAFAAQDFAADIVRVTGEFQKMEAVLVNTLGDKTRAAAALENISQFAANTPFQVDELTDSFVKLANRGFVPTMREMTILGDIASSTGKSFNQLVEAFLDAQTGQYERLKEFGIKAKKSGDDVIFSFKGVETQVANSNEAITEYMLSLGELEGVQGSMAAISETVAGKISNFTDNVTLLQKAIGDSSSGLISSLLDLANTGVGALTDFMKVGGLELLFNPQGVLKSAQAKAAGTTMLDVTKLSDKEISTKMGDVGSTVKRYESRVEWLAQAQKDLARGALSDRAKGNITAEFGIGNITQESLQGGIMQQLKFLDMSRTLRKNLSIEQAKRALGGGNEIEKKKGGGNKGGTGSSQSSRAELTNINEQAQGTELSTNRTVKSLTIQIDKLVGVEQLHTTNLQNTSNEVGEMVKKALLMQITDVTSHGRFG